MKKYEILTKDNWLHFVDKTNDFIKQVEDKNFPFKPMNIIVKSYRKDKTPSQHKFYWVIIGKIVKRLKQDGIETNSEQLHECFKTRIDFVDQVMLGNGEVLFYTKSIKDNSEDVNIKVMNELIDYTLRWAVENIELHIEDER